MKRRIKLLSGGVLIVIAAGVLILNFLLPALLLPRLNSYLAQFSPVYSLHINKLSLNLLRMAYTFHGISGNLKRSGQPFLAVRDVEVSISWRELLHLRILTKVEVNEGDAILTKDLFDSSAQTNAAPKEDANKVANKLFPIRIASVELQRTTIHYAELANQKPSALWTVRDIQGHVFNLNPTIKRPLTSFDLHGQFLTRGNFKITGAANRRRTPVAFKVKTEILNFDLPAANPALITWVPVSFSAGTLNIFAELQSENGKINGYAKPFFEHVKVFKPEQKIKTSKQLLFEILAAVGNLILRRHEDKTVAAKIPFQYDGTKWNVDTGKALSTAFENGFQQPIRPGFDPVLEKPL